MHNALARWLDCTELDYLAMHADNQDRGIAAQTVASGLKEARIIDIDVYVGAFRPGVGLYRRLGFASRRSSWWTIVKRAGRERSP